MVSEVHHSIDLKSSQFFQHSVMAAAEKEAPNRLKLKISRVKSEILTTKSEPKGPNHATKRGPSAVLDGSKAKKQRLDGSVMQQCSALLKMLMTQDYSWVFNEPVDPVKLKIPDYFTIVSKPMDLGTIKSKLQKKLYMHPEDFAADIRLTFSNAILYNPPHNDVHQMAKEYRKIFEKGWADIQSKLSMDREPARKHLILEERASLVNVMRQDNHKKLVCHTKSAMSKTSSQSSLTETSCGRDSLKDFHKGTVNVKAKSFGSVTVKSVRNPAACQSCGNLKCSCTHLRDSFEISSDLDSVQSSYRDSNRTCSVGRNNMDHVSNETANKQMGISDPESDGAVSAVDEGNAHTSSCPDTCVNTATSGEGWDSSICDEQLSPSKALRAALLRSRFADTILKARQKTLLDNGEKDDRMRMKQEKERLEKKQREEKARIEAKVKAAEAALKRREEAQLRMQRKREREAARTALEKVEKTVEICVNNVRILEELEMLAGCKFVKIIELHRNPLERLGLFMKEDYLEDDEKLDLREDVEEGEIPL